MSNKPDHTDYFREILRRLKKMESESNKNLKQPEDEIYGELGNRIEFMELPFPPEMFERLSADEKETLYIWLNRRNIPQA